MELALVRFNGTEGYTSGRLYANGMFLCNTLEDEVREIDGAPTSEWKVPKRTAIPRGRYRVVLTMSPKFGRVLPEVLNVQGFSGIRIHRGNVSEHTEGCPLVGLPDGNELDGWLGNSAKAEGLVIAKIQEAIGTGKQVWLTVV